MSNPNAKGRPRLQRGKDAARVSITLPPAMLRALDRIKMPRSELIRLALEQYLERERHEKSE